jgi:hypothetical protein
MSERSERRARDIAKAAQWTVETIAERFEQMPFPAHDIAHGAGEQVGAPPAGWDWDAYLLHRAEFYPDAGVVRITTPDVRIELFRAAPPILGEDGVLVENEARTSRVIFQRSGHVTVDIMPPTPPEPLEATTTNDPTPEHPTELPSSADASQTPSVAPQRPSSEPTGPSSSAE